MRPRLTWKRRQWSEGALVPQLPELSRDFGADIASIAEFYAALVAEALDSPSAQDLKRTLAEIERAPESVSVSRLDGFCFAELMRHAWRDFGVTALANLQPAQLARCAGLALRTFSARTGRPRKHELAVACVARVLQLRPALRGQARRDLVSEVLKQTKLASPDEKTVALLIAKAGHLF